MADAFFYLPAYADASGVAQSPATVRLVDMGDGTYAVAATDAPCDTRQDVGATYTYYGKAPPASATSAAVWSISRMTNATGDNVYTAAGAATQVWDDRASLAYP